AQESLKKNSNSLIWDMCGNNLEKIDGKMVFDASKMGDLTAKILVEQYIEYLSCGISTFVTIFRPEIIILGGGLVGAGQELFEELNIRTYDNTFGASEIGVPKIVKAELGNNAGIIGAALLEKYADKR
nr:ROK family protein [Vallitaleaceae bacterium]